MSRLHVLVSAIIIGAIVFAGLLLWRVVAPPSVAWSDIAPFDPGESALIPQEKVDAFNAVVAEVNERKKSESWWVAIYRRSQAVCFWLQVVIAGLIIVVSAWYRIDPAKANEMAEGVAAPEANETVQGAPPSRGTRAAWAITVLAAVSAATGFVEKSINDQRTQTIVKVLRWHDAAAESKGKFSEAKNATEAQAITDALERKLHEEQ